MATKEVSEFDGRRFGRIQCGPEVRNHDGSRRVVPDLLIILLKRERYTILPSQDGLFVECKPVDGKHAVGAHYCERGIRRFVDGEYAWAMQDGLMVGYVRGGRSVAKDLTPILLEEQRHARMGSPNAPSAIKVNASESTEPLQVTVHRRNFVWPGGGGTATAIRLFHSWHDCV